MSTDINPILLEVPDHLQTARLDILSHTQDFVAQVNAAVLDSMNELAPWMPWATKLQSMDDTMDFCRRSQAKFLTREALHYRFCLRGTDTVIGTCGVFHIDWKIRKCELGYWCRTTHHRKGLMTEGVAALAKMLKEDLNFRRIEIRCDALNDRSRALAERLGFMLEGILRKDSLGNDNEPRDTCIFALVG